MRWCGSGKGGGVAFFISFFISTWLHSHHPPFILAKSWRPYSWHHELWASCPLPTIFSYDTSLPPSPPKKIPVTMSASLLRTGLPRRLLAASIRTPSARARSMALLRRVAGRMPACSRLMPCVRASAALRRVTF